MPPRSSRQMKQVTQALALAILPVLIPAGTYYAAGGRDFQWRLLLAGILWILGSYTQIVAIARKKRRFLLGSGILYLLGGIFSFTVLGPVGVAFVVLYEGLLTMLWIHKKSELTSAAEVLSPYVSLFTGIVLTLGVLVIGLSS